MKGLTHHQQGALEEAIAAYLQALRARPHRVVACYNLGVALIDAGMGLSSLPFLKRALLQKPDSQVFRGAVLYALTRSGRFAEAQVVIDDGERSGLAAETLARWTEWLKAQAPGSGDADGDALPRPSPAQAMPELPDAPLMLPSASQAQGRLREPFDQALRDYQAGRFEALLDRLRPLLGELPSWGEGHHLSGLALMALKRFDLAASSLERAAELIPGRGELWDHLGVVYARLGRTDGVMRAFEQSLVLSPLRAETWNNAADAALRRNDLPAAYQSAFQALRLNPALTSASYCLLQAAYKLDEAAADSEELRGAPSDWLSVAVKAVKASAVDPEHVLTVSSFLSDLGQFEHAAEMLKLSLERSGNQPPTLLANLVRNQRHACDWEGLAEREAWLSGLARDSEASVVEPFVAMTVAALGPADLLRIARQRAQAYRPWLERALPRPSRHQASLDRRIRIGYLSDDFQDHATAYLTASVFEHHDRQRFEVFAYSTGLDDGGVMRRRLASAFEHFVDIRSLGHPEAADRICDDGIDILVDLKGYTKNARLEILAMRPSPIQMTWLGFPGGLGTSFIDYLIADSEVVPAEQAAHYDEAMAYLPDAYAPVDPQRRVAPTPARAQAGLPTKGFVFCCFNDPYKITPEVFGCWCGLLKEVPGSVLWLYARTPAIRGNLVREAEARGVAAERLVFASKLPQAEHLARLALADLFLDTWPVNAHTTASDALWMGVPVLTRAGETFASRVAASLLTATGLPELVTSTLEAYQARALEIATSPDLAVQLRRRLAEARRQAPFFDVARFTRNLEGLYERAWERYASGAEPGQLEPRQSGS
ncbi:tetratricopeptide repeat protein [Thiorhodococcus minor]|uniref:protein O-GlcNAc transferase n=1 Tax=Thiorhodococcus minor TaxID=57489 RepID=A0A6M0JZ95_9GAMM|nr:tetratricopeptide repeat protein [Thiorhodococcus minor]